MALLGATPIAAVEGMQSTHAFQRSILWGSSSGTEALTRRSLPVGLQPSMKKNSVVGKRIASICVLQSNRPTSMADEPKSPGKVVPSKVPTLTNKGWSDKMDLEDHFLVKQLRDLAAVASDRSEMHQVVSIQRDNWNSLLHNTITMGSVSAAIAAALNGGMEHALGLSVVASGLGLGVALLMALVSFFQPAQMAEEQRTAARFFKRLMTDIESTLQIDHRLRQEASQYLEQKLATVHALDRGFPLPLTPIVLEKFPKLFSPSVLGPPTPSTPELPILSSFRSSINGWTSSMEKDLKRTSQILHTSDIPTYMEMAVEVNRLNKVFAIYSTVLAMSGVLFNMVDGAMSGRMHLSVLGAALTVGAFFLHSLSHATQLGAAYETYRNCAGYYADMERLIETALRTPVEEREYGVTFLQKIALQLGRSPADSPIIPLDEEKAGMLF
ncbi:unnamed protein product [Calypogeia fissa]